MAKKMTVMDKDINLADGLDYLPYVYEPNHKLLNTDIVRDYGSNIGFNGENLTITFLSLNRTSLSEKLLLSIEQHIPYFRGEVLIVDNGSHLAELDRLREVSARLRIPTRIIDLGKNFGVSGGRNRTIEHVNTEWVMFLDNDIYLTANPIPRIQDDIALLGCHFLSLPLLNPDGRTLFANGGNIYVSFDDCHVHVGAGSAIQQTEISEFDGPGFLSTFLFGGACVLKKQSFLNMGGYDEAMFIGFEDIDFSIRLFRHGMKVGTTGAIVLIHDHPLPSTTEDIEYEKMRFARKSLRNSAYYLEKKYGFQFWSPGVEFWLNDKHHSLEIAPLSVSLIDRQEQDSTTTILPTGGKPRIALIIDSESWAFANIARQIVRHLDHRFDFQVIPTEVVSNIDQVLMMTADCDITHFFWRESLNLANSQFAKLYMHAMGFSVEDFFQRYVRSRVITTSVYDHLFLSEAELEARLPLFTDMAKGYTVSSQRLMTIYQSIKGYPKPLQLTEDGVDLKLFKPNNLERFNSLGGRPLVIGWAGNSKWAAERQGDEKGFHTILKPAVEALQREGLNIRLELADRQERFIPHEEMPAYYEKLDLYVCVSKSEGTPNPVLEATACGVPVISTDVGVVPQLFDGDPFGMILARRDIDELKRKIQTVCGGDWQLIKDISTDGLHKIQAWDWRHKVKNFELFFDSVLSSNGNPPIYPQ